MNTWISHNKILTAVIVLAVVAAIVYFFFGWFKTTSTSTSTTTATNTATSSDTTTSMTNTDTYPGGFKKDVTDGKCYGYDAKGNRAWVGDIECTSRGIN